MSFKFRILSVLAIIATFAFAAFGAQAQTVTENVIDFPTLFANNSRVAGDSCVADAEAQLQTDFPAATITVNSGTALYDVDGNCVFTGGASNPDVTTALGEDVFFNETVVEATDANDPVLINDILNDSASVGPQYPFTVDAAFLNTFSGGILRTQGGDAPFDEVRFEIPDGEFVTVSSITTTGAPADDTCELFAQPNPVPEQTNFEVSVICGAATGNEYFGLQAEIRYDFSAASPVDVPTVGDPEGTVWDNDDMDPTFLATDPFDLTEDGLIAGLDANLTPINSETVTNPGAPTDDDILEYLYAVVGAPGAPGNDVPPAVEGDDTFAGPFNAAVLEAYRSLAISGNGRFLRFECDGIIAPDVDGGNVFSVDAAGCDALDVVILDRVLPFLDVAFGVDSDGDMATGDFTMEAVTFDIDESGTGTATDLYTGTTAAATDARIDETVEFATDNQVNNFSATRDTGADVTPNPADAASLVEVTEDNTSITINVQAESHASCSQTLDETSTPPFTDGVNVVTGTATLLAGDTNDDGNINTTDATAITGNFGATVINDNTDTTDFADVNNDDTIDIFDLVHVGRNFDDVNPAAADCGLGLALS